MAETRSSRKTKNDEMTESDMDAAQQLMQLSDEGSNNITAKRNKSSECNEEQEVDQNIRDITLAKIEEIFGKEEDYRPKKQRRYRSLLNIYMETRPIHVGKRENVSTRLMFKRSVPDFAVSESFSRSSQENSQNLGTISIKKSENRVC